MSLFSRLFRKAPPAVSPQKSPGPSASGGPAPTLPAGQPAQKPAPQQKSGEEAARQAAQEEQALKAAIDGGDAGSIARLVLEGSSTKIRQQAAEAVEDPARLRELIKAVRGGKDKNVYKILARKRDALHAKEREQEQLQAEIAAVSAAIERHGQRQYDPLFTPTLEQLESRWKAVAPQADPAMQRKAQQAIDLAREVIAQHLRQVAVEASRELAAANAAAEAQRRRELEEKAAAVNAAEQAAIAEAERKALAEKQEAHMLAVRQLGALLRKAMGALNDGSTGRAAGLRRAIEEKLPAAAPVPAWVTGQLQQLDARLEELKDWKRFSVAPKRVELMERMEALIGAELAPPALAERIKQLQEQWRTLSKGAGENLEADWQRFQAAAQQAYQPCREYFEAQALVRQENLARRAALLDRLAAFEAEHDWQQPDWRRVMTALRESRQEWRRHAPVDRAPAKSLQERFDALTATLQSRLDAEYARNTQQKQSLIERARHLVDMEDSRKAIEEVKELQRAWQGSGPVPRAQDQQLWEAFRQQCDAVFQKRQQAFTEYTAGLEANAASAKALCEELENIAALSGAQLLESFTKASQIRESFEALGEFPRKEARDLRRRFERALENCAAAMDRQKAEDAERSWNDLFEAARHVNDYRLALATNANAAECDRLKQTAETFLAGVLQWPKGGQEALRNALAGGSVGEAARQDAAANEAALRTLCIRAEILLDLPTPPEDQGLRREYQMKRLLQGMGQGLDQGVSGGQAQLDRLTLEWAAIAPVETGAYQNLLQRFRQCRQQRLTRGALGEGFSS